MAHSAGKCEAALNEQSLAQALDWAIEQHRIRHPALMVGFEVVDALSIIAHALDNPSSEYRLELVRKGRRSKRKSMPQWEAEFANAEQIAVFVWERLGEGVQSKAAFGKACDEFNISHETAYKAVRTTANRLMERRRFHTASNERIEGYGLPPFGWKVQHSSEFEKWLEGFAGASPEIEG